MARLPPLIALRAFEVTARLNNVGQAATALNVTHPAINHQLRQLEAWFDTPLLMRRGRCISLTTAGEQLSVSLTDAFSRIDQACAKVNAERMTAPLILACIGSVASRWLLPLVAQFTTAHPDLPVRQVSATGHSDILTEDMDLAIIQCDSPYTGSLEAHPLFSGAAQPVCSPTLLNHGHTLGQPEDLLKAHLLHDVDNKGWQQWFTNAGLADIAPQPGLVFDDFNLMSTAAIAGHGVALCPMALIEQDVQLGLLKVLSHVKANADRHYVLVHRAHCSAQVIALRDWLLERVPGHTSEEQPRSNSPGRVGSARGMPEALLRL